MTSARAARAAVALIASAALLAVPGRAAAATEVTAEHLDRLVERAPTDPSALAELRRVDRVDGRPVDLGRALAGAGGEVLDARLRSLGSGGGEGREPAPAPVGAAARDDARRILEGRRFNPSPVPRPFRGALRRIGGWLRPVTGPLGRLWDRVIDNSLATGALGLAVVGVAAFVAARLVARRTSAGVGRGRADHRRGDRDDPDALERSAAAAERAGDLERALRLRFRAGVVRLHRAGAIVDRPALTTGELTRRVASPRLRELTRTFEEVAYGRRPATADDVEGARGNWPRALEEARGR